MLSSIETIKAVSGDDYPMIIQGLRTTAIGSREFLLPRYRWLRGVILAGLVLLRPQFVGCILLVLFTEQVSILSERANLYDRKS